MKFNSLLIRLPAYRRIFPSLTSCAPRPPPPQCLRTTYLYQVPVRCDFWTKVEVPVLRKAISDDFLKYVGAICRPWQLLTESTATWTTYTQSEQTLFCTSPPHTCCCWWWCHLRVPLCIRKAFSEKTPTESVTKPALKLRDNPSIITQFCSHHNRLQAQ